MFQFTENKLHIPSTMVQCQLLEGVQSILSLISYNI